MIERIYNIIFTSYYSRNWFRDIQDDEDFVLKYSRFLIIHGLKFIIIGMTSLLFIYEMNNLYFKYSFWTLSVIIIVILTIIYLRIKFIYNE